MTPSDERIRDAVAQQAAEWFVANQSGPLDYAERASFVAWLKTSPVHVEEYLGVALVARDLPAATSKAEISLESLLESARADDAAGVASISLPVRKAERRATGMWIAQRRAAFALAACAMLVLLVPVLWWMRDGEWLRLPKSYETQRGEQSQWQLPDGSALHLNTDSAAVVRYSGRERVVELTRGEALFQVVHQDFRPFRVTAGVADVIAVGTRFNVYRRLDRTIVTVVEGEVRVIANPRARLTGSGLSPSDTRYVKAGFQLSVDAGGVSTQPMAVDLGRALAWLQRMIAFERRPLGEVAEEFNRYSRVPIEIDDAALRALPVSGVFDPYDTDSFARFLTTLDGVIVERTATRIRVLRLKSEAERPITTAR